MTTTKTVVLTGTATVKFRKVITGCSPEDVESLQSYENQECNIDDDDCNDIVEITDIRMEVKP